MLHNTQAARASQEGCRRLGLPSSTATALLQFLSVKRVHDQFVDVKQLHMTPCVKVEQLWQWMLLNTAGESFVAISSSTNPEGTSRI
jgi:hypothetical protein